MPEPSSHESGTRYTICFDFPDAAAPLFAGKHKGAAGWAPTLDTAWLFDDEEAAERWLENGYGAASQYGSVVEVPSA